MSREDIEPVEVACQLRRTTERALLIYDGKVEAWIPLSQISERQDRNGALESITIPLWLAKEKDLI